MATTTDRLVLLGGADLGFRDGSGAKRRVVRGEEFEVDADTAEILLTDPNVQRAADVPRGTTGEAATPSAPTKAELRARATELALDVPTRATNAEIAAAIDAEESRLADAAAAASSGERNEGGSGTPASDPGASASGEAGQPPSSDTGGAITLGDLPDGAKVGAG
jgi:hypothetical protein